MLTGPIFFETAPMPFGPVDRCTHKSTHALSIDVEEGLFVRARFGDRIAQCSSFSNFHLGSNWQKTRSPHAGNKLPTQIKSSCSICHCSFVCTGAYLSAPGENVYLFVLVWNCLPYSLQIRPNFRSILFGPTFNFLFLIPPHAIVRSPKHHGIDLISIHSFQYTQYTLPFAD